MKNMNINWPGLISSSTRLNYHLINKFGLGHVCVKAT